MKLHPRAAILLMSLLIISGFTLLLALALSELNLGRGTIQLHRAESSRELYLAEACLEESIFRYEQDLSFLGTTLTLEDGSTCSSSVNANTITISVSNGAYSEQYQATFSTSTTDSITNVSLETWTESP